MLTAVKSKPRSCPHSAESLENQLLTELTSKSISTDSEGRPTERGIWEVSLKRSDLKNEKEPAVQSGEINF